MMFAVYIVVASIALSALLLWGLTKWSSRSRDAKSNGDVASALRVLLLAKAQGHIDQDEFDRRQAALHAALLTDSPATPGVMPAFKPSWVIVPLALAAAGALYVAFSGPKPPSPSGSVSPPSSFPASTGSATNNKGGDLNTVVKRLESKMASDPGNGEGWQLLAKTYGELRRFAEADAAYEKAAALLPADAGMLADWADAHVMAMDRKWDAAGRAIVKRALAADPKHVKSLALAGSEAFERGDYKEAIGFWKRMKAVATPDSMDGKLADANIAEAEAMMSGKTPENSAPQLLPNAVVGGVVTLSPKLRNQVSSGDTLFVVAKAPDGKGAPLAVWKYVGTDFPVEFRLDDSAAILPGRTLSQYPEVVVSAKLSKSGSAEPGKGDISTPSIKTKLGNTSMALELNVVN